MQQRRCDEPLCPRGRRTRARATPAAPVRRVTLALVAASLVLLMNVLLIITRQQPFG